MRPLRNNFMSSGLEVPGSRPGTHSVPMLALPLPGVWSGPELCVPNGPCDLGLVISLRTCCLFISKLDTQQQLPPYQDCKPGQVGFLGSSPCQPLGLPFFSCSPHHFCFKGLSAATCTYQYPSCLGAFAVAILSSWNLFLLYPPTMIPGAGSLSFYSLLLTEFP